MKYFALLTSASTLLFAGLFLNSVQENRPRGLLEEKQFCEPYLAKAEAKYNESGTYPSGTYHSTEVERIFFSSGLSTCVLVVYSHESAYDGTLTDSYDLIDAFSNEHIYTVAPEESLIGVVSAIQNSHKLSILDM